MRRILISLSLIAPAGLWSQINAVTLLDGGGSTLGTYSSISQAYAAITTPLSQAYTVQLETIYDGSMESFPINLGLLTGSSATNTVTIRPAANVVSMTIQASVGGGNLMTLNDADYIILDGRAGGIGNTGVLTLSNSGTTSNSNTIQLINGACFNVIRYCTIENGTTSSAGRGIGISTSASNITGNSNNIIEYCDFNSGRYRFNSSGTTANLNANNTVHGCNFENPIFAAIWSQSGTGNITIDSCNFYSNISSGSGLFFGILFDAQRDTAVVSNNRIINLQDAAVGNLRAIQVRSTTVGAPNETRIFNNFISLEAGNTDITNMAGIEFSGTNTTYGKVEHNSIYIGGTLTAGGTAGAVGSAGVLISLTNSASVIDVRNNIIKNERSGGTAGLLHSAASYAQTTLTLNLEENTYLSSTGTPVTYGASVYNDVASYVAAVSPNENNSNEVSVLFVSNSDLHLDGASINDPLLYGVAIPQITTDIDGDPRLTPFRGADEGTPLILCSGIPVPGPTAITTDIICPGGTVTMFTDSLEESGITYQWYSSNDGVNFAPISGATDTMYSESPGGTTYYVCEIACTNSGQAAYTNGLMVTVLPVPAGGTIAATNVAYDYSFSVSGLPAGTYNYAWDFGDGGTSSLEAPDHSYAVSGTYTVTLTVSNACGSETLSYTVYITLGLENVAQGEFTVYPNPAKELIYVNANTPTQVDLLDPTGRIILSSAASNAHKLSVAHLASGTYYLKVEQEGQQYLRKIIIE